MEYIDNLDIRKNPLNNREDFIKSLQQLLSPCSDNLINNGTGLFNGVNLNQCAGRTASMEGWSRLLWGIAPLKKAGYTWKGEKEHVNGFIDGVNPNSPNYFGKPLDSNQLKVEMAAMGYSLILSPETFYDPLTDEQKDNLIHWLISINDGTMPMNNWHFFRIIVELALEKLQRPEFDNDLMERDLDLMESFYEGDGWYRDLDKFDGYNPFAIQYYMLFYYSMKKDIDKERCARIKKRVYAFAQQYQTFFTSNGQIVPYGRSLSYRFAVVSFFSACVYAGLEVLPLGIMKGLINRNLRWWFQQPIFDRTGMLTMGYRYPSHLVTEQYITNESVYWCMKVYILLALDKDNPYWSVKEEAMPEFPPLTSMHAVKWMTQKTRDGDVVLLNPGQNVAYQMNSTAEKYNKFAYSAYHGFNTAISNFDFEKLGCDNMLYFSEGNGYWRPRRSVRKRAIVEGKYVSSEWSPFYDVQVKTYIIPCNDYHICVHKIQTERSLITREGGFPIKQYNEQDLTPQTEVLSDNLGSIGIRMPWGTSALIDCTALRSASFVQPVANLNLNFSTVLVPYLEGHLTKKSKALYVTLVGAGADKRFFYKHPKVSFDEETNIITIDNKKLTLK